MARELLRVSTVLEADAAGYLEGQAVKRCVAELQDGYVNICADRLELNRAECMIYAWNGTELAGAFDVSAVIKIYISERRASV